MDREWLASVSQAWGGIALRPLLFQTERQKAITLQVPARCKCTALSPIRGLLLSSSSPMAAGRHEAFCESF